MVTNSKKKSKTTDSDIGRETVFSSDVSVNQRGFISKLLIENFQAHEKTKIELVPGINVFIGSSDSGKSSVLRALKWVLLNQPNGNSFHSFWSKNTKVKAMVADKVITRIRTKSKNQYKLGDELFEAFGATVPEEISLHHNIKENNIQNQMDAPFLLSQSSGEVARLCNRAVNLELIDTVSSAIRGVLLNTRQRLSFCKEGLENEKIKLEKYDNIPKITKLIDLGEQKEQSKIDKYNKANTIKKHIGIIVENKEASIIVNACNKQLTILNKLEKLYSKKKEKENLINSINRWLKIVDNNKEASKGMEGLDQQLSLLATIERKLDKQLKAKQNFRKINQSLNYIDLQTTQHQKLDKQLKEQELYLKQNMPEECPLCHNKIVL